MSNSKFLDDHAAGTGYAGAFDMGGEGADVGGNLDELGGVAAEVSELEVDVAG